MMFEQLTEESSNLGSNNDVDLEKLLKLGDWKGLFRAFDIARELFLFLMKMDQLLQLINLVLLH